MFSGLLEFLDVFGIKKDFCVGTKKRSDIAATPPFLDLLFSNYQLSIVNWITPILPNLFQKDISRFALEENVFRH